MESEAHGDDEPVQAFLARLKLDEKYAHLFHENGYMTVGDCRGLTEKTLQDMGVTLAGHYKRILSKLPGCTLRKPPRTNRSVSAEQTEALPTEPLPEVPSAAPPTQEEFEPEDAYLSHGGESPIPVDDDDKPSVLIDEAKIIPLSPLARNGNPLDDPSDTYWSLNRNGPPIKPPRSPDRLRAALGNLPALHIPKYRAQDSPSPQKSPSSFEQAVFQVLGDASRSGSSCGMHSSDDEDEDDDAPIPVLNAPGSSSDWFKTKSLERNNASPDSISLELPPPPLGWVSGEEGASLPYPAATSELDAHSISENVEEGAYDRLDIARSATATGSPSSHTCASSPDESSGAYGRLTGGSTRLEVPAGPRLRAYEEIEFTHDLVEPDSREQTKIEINLSEQDTAANVVGLSSTQAGPVAAPRTSKIAAARDDSAPVSPQPSEQTQSEDLMLASEDAYDTAKEPSSLKDDDESENVYAECDNGMLECRSTQPRSVVVARSSSSASNEDPALPRSSGSLPASAYRDRRPLVRFRGEGAQKSVDLSDHSDNESKTTRRATVDSYDDAEAIYQSIDDNERRGSTAKTDYDKTKKRPHIKLRLGKRTKSRPTSAFLDHFRSDAFTKLNNEDLDGSDENLAASPPAAHTRSFSTSVDRSSSADLVDVNLPDEARTPKTCSPMTHKKTRKGWLMKHGWHEGRAPVRKRWVVFDGSELSYYENEKSELSKGIIPLEVILRVQVPQTEPKVFHIMTKGGRKYIFGSESTDDTSMWTSTLVAAKMMLDKQGPSQFKPGGSMCMPYKEGNLKLDGSKVYLATKGDQLAYYKSNQEFLFGQPVARMSMKVATVKTIDKKKFQVIFPYKTFTFSADSEEDKQSWVEALNDSIAEALSDYKVIGEIWQVETNRKCADCGREDPDWSSLNLAIVICKHCAGVHRELGVHNSKVRSLKMDVKVWDDSMRTILLEIGNVVANKFWASRLPASEAITDMADKKQRAWHINSKYIEMQYADTHRHTGNQGQLNQALINAVRNNNLAEAYSLVFSGADPNCDTGKEHAKTPYRLAQHLNYNALAELLRQNGATTVVSPQGHVTDRSTNVQKKDSFPKTRAKPPVTLRDCLWKYGGDFRNATEEHSSSKGGFTRIKNVLQQGDFQKRMCVLENNILKYYDPEKTNILKDDVDCSELISIGICQPEQATKAGFQYCFEVGRKTGRTYLFCAERKDVFLKWIRGLLQAILPPHVQNALRQDFEYDRMGYITMKTQHWAKKSSEWAATWCKLKGKNLHYYHNESRTMECIDLRRLVQLGLDQTQDKASSAVASLPAVNPVFMLVFREKTYYFQSCTKPDTESWLAAVRKADGDCGPRLDDQQLTSEGVPIILEKCMTFVEQFGLTTRGIYRLSGTHSKTSQLLSDFKQNARETQMLEGEVNVHDVANALKRWFKGLPGSLLTEQLHDDWLRTAHMKQEQHEQKLNWYKHLVERLPDINRQTLRVVLVHLNNVASHANENEMTLHNLAIVFGPTLMEPQAEDGNQFMGQTSEEIACIEDLLQYYGWLFDVTELDREKERLMLEAKNKISLATQQQNMLTTLDYDMMVPIYINSRDDKCVNYKVNMTAGELVGRICTTHGYPPKSWGLYEVISDGDAERPLHYNEHVLSVIKAWEMPSTNYLVAKHDYIRDKMRWFRQTKTSDSQALCEGQLKMYETKKKWSKVTASMRIVDGVLTLQYAKVKSVNTVPLIHYNMYVGVDHKTKPPMPRKSGFTFATRGEITRQFCVEPESHVYRWIGLFLQHKHPEGLTPPDSPQHHPEKLDSPPTKTKEPSVPLRYPPISQQDLGEAVRQVALRRQSSASDDSPRESVYEAALPVGVEATDSLEPQRPQLLQDLNAPRHFNFAGPSSNDGSLPRRSLTMASPSGQDSQRFRNRLETYHDTLRLFGDRCVAVLTSRLRSPTYPRSATPTPAISPSRSMAKTTRRHSSSLDLLTSSSGTCVRAKCDAE